MANSNSNKYRSGFEARVSANLEDRGVDFEYESERLDFITTVRAGECAACGSKEVVKRRKYTPDFVIRRHDCSKFYIEAKGYLKSTDRSLLRDVKKSNPHLDIKLLFQRDGWVKKGVQRYSDWAEKFGFEWAVGQVPETWL